MKRLLLAVLLGVPVAASAQNDAPPSTTSADRRFVATGPDPEDNLRIVRWAEKNARSIEDLLGQPVPIAAHSPIVLRLHPAATNEAPGAVVSQRQEGARFLQELRITGLRAADPEDLLETFTLLMIHRGVHELRASLPQAALRGPAYVPAWFATGCAQNLHRTTRARNRAVVLRAFEAGGGLTAQEILRLQSLPRGRWASKAECGLFVGWLASREDFPALRAALFRQFASGGPADAPWLCEQLPDATLLDDLEKHWDLWRLRSTQVRAEDTGLYDDAPGRLAALFPVNRERLAAIGATGMERDLDASELASFRAEPWFPKLVGALRAETLTLSAGQPPEFQRILAAWDAWYQSLLDLPVTARESATGRVEFPAEMRKRSAALLQAAQAPLHAYRQRVRGLARYVDDFEERSAAANIPETADNAPGPRTEHQQYVDRFDEAIPKPPPPRPPVPPR
jgi:hypothetical protein